MKRILPLFFLFFFLTPAYADEFKNTLDGVDNGFVSAISYGINMEKLPQEGIEYSVYDLQGESTQEGLARRFESYISDTGRHLNGWVPGAFAYSPPGGTVDILYHYKNNAGHYVNIPEIAISYSTTFIQNREWFEDFAELEKGQEYIFPLQFLHAGLMRERKGVLYSYFGVGVVENGVEGVEIIESLKIKDPIEIGGVEVQERDGGLDIAVTVRNRSIEMLDSLVFTHGEFEEIFSIAPKREYVVRYFLENKQEEDISSFRIRNENICAKCAVNGSSFSSGYDVGSVSVFSRRENMEWVSGMMMGPANPSFCILRIPYTKVITFTEPEEVVVEEEPNNPTQPEEEKPPQGNSGDEESLVGSNGEGAEDNNSTESGDVLGKSSSKLLLPKTGAENGYVLLGALMLLVVDVLLWYSVIRKKHEKRNIFTKICTKSWKNSSQRRV